MTLTFPRAAGGSEDQNLFREQLINLDAFPISRHRLTLNLRNTRNINRWLQQVIPGLTLRDKLTQGPEVQTFAWKTRAEELALARKEIRRLVTLSSRPFGSSRAWSRTLSF